MDTRNEAPAPAGSRISRRELFRRAGSAITAAAFVSGAAGLLAACASQPAAPSPAAPAPATQPAPQPTRPPAAAAPAQPTPAPQAPAQATATPRPAAQPTAQPTAVPQPAMDTRPLVLAQIQDILTLDPPFHRARATQNVHQLIYDSLVHRTNELVLRGHLAESWEMVDPTTFQFKMRANARWHDGTPVRAQDVKFSYDRTLDPDLKAPRAGLMDMVASVEAPNDQTVLVKTKHPDPLTLVFLNYHAIVPMDQVKARGEAFFEKPIGAGPFMFESWRKNEQVVLKANPNYWGGSPLIETLIIRPIPDAATMLAELESGGVDIVPDVPATHFEQIQGNPNLQTLTTPSTVVQYIGLNTKMKPFDDVRVRQAMNHGVDKDAIITNLLRGLATPIAGPLFPEVRGYDPSVAGYEYNVDKAKALLSEAGLGSGFEATLDTTAPNKEIAEALAGQWRQIGANIRVNVGEAGVLGTRQSQGELQMYFAGWGDSTANAGVTYFRHFHSGQRAQFADTGYAKPELDRIIDEGRQELDMEKRAAIFRQALKIIVDDAPWVFLWQPQSLAAARANIQGFTPRPDAYLFLEKVSRK